MLAAAAVCCPASAQTPLFPPDERDQSPRPYDVLHYRLAVDLRREAEKTVEGTAALTLVSLAPRLDSVTLDAVALTVLGARSELRRTSTPMAYASGPSTLTLFPTPAPAAGETLTVTIRYTATPAAGLFFLAPDSADPLRRRQIWTQGQEIDNRHWFPCNDRNTDKASSEVIATVNAPLVVVSNGRLVSARTDPANGASVYHWRQEKPHSAYLVVLAAGEYTVLRDSLNRLPLLVYAYPDRVADTRRALGRTGAMLRFFEQTLQFPYPWEKYAQVVIDEFMWGGMENTSVVTLNEDVMITARDSLDYTPDPTVAHEVAHMWFGDLVTCRDWSHMWLNEGFASYLEQLYFRDLQGPDRLSLGMRAERLTVVGEERRAGNAPMVARETYAGFVYAKGSWVLHMLWELLGEETFLRAVRSYLRHFAYRTADTQEFQRAVEDATGHRLGWFFRQWAFTGGHPVVTVQRSWDAGTGMLLLEIGQRNSGDPTAEPFRFQLPVTVVGGEGDSTFVVRVDSARTIVAVPSPVPPRLVLVDPHVTLLATIRQTRTTEEYLRQLAGPTPVAARLEAADSLVGRADDPAVFRALAQAAGADPEEGVRAIALRGLAAGSPPAALPSLLASLRDSSPLVRRTAARSLGRYRGTDVEQALAAAVDGDSSNGVLAEGLSALAEVNSAIAQPRIRAALGVESWRHWVRRTALGLLRRFPDSTALPSALPFLQPGHPPDMRLSALSFAGAGGRSDDTARRAVFAALDDHDASLRERAAQILGRWGDAESKARLERRGAVEQDPTVERAIREALEEEREERGTSEGNR
jgi:aminopeptidase N